MKELKRVIATLLVVVLSAKIGTVNFNGHRETWYDLNLRKVIARADAYYGLKDVYAVREDGVKTYNGLVIVASNWKVHPYGSVVETSLGKGIVLDHHTAKDPELIDIATDWR